MFKNKCTLGQAPGLGDVRWNLTRPICPFLELVLNDGRFPFPGFVLPAALYRTAAAWRGVTRPVLLQSASANARRWAFYQRELANTMTTIRICHE